MCFLFEIKINIFLIKRRNNEICVVVKYRERLINQYIRAKNEILIIKSNNLYKKLLSFILFTPNTIYNKYSYSK